MVDLQEETSLVISYSNPTLPSLDSQLISQISSRVAQSSRPIFLIGGGVDHCTGQELAEALSSSRLPLMTTYNGADRVDNHLAVFWSTKYLGQGSNILLQQSINWFSADLPAANSFNWQEFQILRILFRLIPIH